MELIDLGAFSTAEAFLNRENLIELFRLTGADRAEALSQLTFRANQYRVKSEFSALYKSLEKEEKAVEISQKRDLQSHCLDGVKLETGEKGQLLPTIFNFFRIINKDPFFAPLRYNDLTLSPEWGEARWTDTHDAMVRAYIEENYKIHHRDKCEDGFRMVCESRRYHPIKDYIEGIVWDGVERIPTMLTRWLHCTDTPYSREVSRLIFAGGINRLYCPGCKFDDVAVLVGGQGAGKSTFIKWLAMYEDWYTDSITEIDGQKGIEALEGVWVCEIAEMLAVTRAKDVEAVKAYITRQNDKYRRPFEHHVSDNPRQCFFIGTTNKPQFLTDKTGGRRWYPIYINIVGYELYDQKEKIQREIRQCWAEALTKYKRGEMPPYADRSLIEDIRRQQAAAAEDDPREGIIRDYLSDKSIVCAVEIWREALGIASPPTPPRRDSLDISLIMENMVGWSRGENVTRFALYGTQRYWKRDEKLDYESLTSV